VSLFDLTAAEISLAIRGGRLSAVAVTEGFLARIEEIDGRLGALIRVTPEEALRDAARIDAGIANDGNAGPLAGVPLLVKDNLCVRDHPVTCGSRILLGHTAAYTATAVARAQAAGAILLGATNLDEFAFGSSGETSAFGPTRNPWDLSRVPGGSSGGSAAAVAARLAPLALGTDTGGSTRQPAALCGVVGVRPTYGRVSRHGLVAFASSMDQIGPIARTVRDAAALLRCIAGPDALDATCAAVPDLDSPGDGPIRLDGVRLGICEDLAPEGLDAEVREHFDGSLKTLRALGAEIVDIGLPTARHAVPTYYLLAMSEASSNLARFDGVRYGRRVPSDDLIELVTRTRGEGFGAEAKRRILLGTFALSAGRREDLHGRATRVRALLRREMKTALASVDAIVTPTSPEPAFPIGERIDDPVRMYACDVLTTPASLAGLPAVSVPCGLTGAGLPVGLQITCDHWRETRMLEIGAAFEDVTGFHRDTPWGLS
jgi:aspartyl-tRNA(Asn)/glutamyl-tRNA(Gln) amidotransferase subunit A